MNFFCSAQTYGKGSFKLKGWLWGATPPGFNRIALREGKMMVVRRGLEDCLFGNSSPMAPEAAAVASPFQGRGKLASMPLADGTFALVRLYRRGGWVQYLTKDLFCTWPPRPFVELAVTERARQRGVLTLEIVAACIERKWGPFYRGWLITRELTGARDLWAALRDKEYTIPDKRALLKAIAASIWQMHCHGVYHRDLNLKNILVRREAGSIRAHIIDFDKAQLSCGLLSPRKIERNLKRLHRSLRKLDPDSRWLSRGEWDLLRDFYHEAGHARS